MIEIFKLLESILSRIDAQNIGQFIALIEKLLALAENIKLGSNNPK